MTEQQNEEHFYTPKYSSMITWFPNLVPDPSDQRLIEELKDLEKEYKALEKKAFDNLNTMRSEIKSVSKSVDEAKEHWEHKFNIFDADRIHSDLTSAQHELSEYSKHLKEFTNECKRCLKYTEAGIAELQRSMQPQPPLSKFKSALESQFLMKENSKNNSSVELVDGVIKLSGGKILISTPPIGHKKFDLVDGEISLISGRVDGPVDKLEDMDDRVVLVDGLLELVAGIFMTNKEDKIELSGGKVKLVGGKITLADPRMTLIDGTVELVNGAVNMNGDGLRLADGTIKLLDGSVTLSP